MTKLGKYCKSCATRDEKYVYLKAKEKLEGELDINRFIKNSRLLRNAFKFLTTKRERHLVRMQSDKNVIVVRDQDKAHLIGEKDSNMEGDSTEFESDEYEEYIQELLKDVDENRIKLTDQERNLVTGISKQNSKQQLHNSVSVYLKQKVTQKN